MLIAGRIGPKRQALGSGTSLPPLPAPRCTMAIELHDDVNTPAGGCTSTATLIKWVALMTLIKKGRWWKS